MTTRVNGHACVRVRMVVTCNQVNFLRNHDGTKSKNELLGNAFPFDVNVANKKREHCKVLLPSHW